METFADAICICWRPILRPFGEDGKFLHLVDHGNVRRLATRGAGATLLSGGTGLATQVIATVVLARLLAPQDFGVVTMVTTFSLLFVNFGLNGFTEAIVQRDEMDHALASNLFWMSIAGSTLLTVGFAAAGNWLGSLYHNGDVAGIARGISITIFLTGFQVVPLALLKRAMKFSVVSANEICARIVSVIVSIAFAVAGFGYWALVAGAIAIPASASIGAFILCRWVPGRPRRAHGTRSSTSFAAFAYGRFSLGYFVNNLDNFLVGWQVGPAALGYYKKAYDLFALSFNQLSGGLTIVAVSALSRLRSHPDQYKRALLTAIGVITLLGMGLSGDLAIIGKDLILVLLGPRWTESGKLFTLFAPGIGFMLLYAAHTWIHLSIGTAARWFRWGMLEMAVTTVFLCVGLHWKAEGIAIAWVLTYWILTLPGLWYAGKPIGFSITPVIGIMWRYIIASAASYGATVLAMAKVPSLDVGSGMLWAFGRIALGTIIFSTIYAGLIILLHMSLEPLRQPVRLAREMLPRGRHSEHAEEEAHPATPLRSAV